LVTFIYDAFKLTHTRDMTTQYQGLLVRINGILSPAVQQQKESGANANTSCSIFDIQEGGNHKNIFHLLVDCGSGVVESIKKGFTEHGFRDNIVPDAMLITHGHKDHINDVPALLSEVENKSQQPSFKIYCTRQCLDQISEQFPSLSEKSPMFSTIIPGKVFEVGPFLIEPILAEHGNAQGAVIYIIKVRSKKIVIGWDFESLPGSEQGQFWNPDLVILGTETYNDHKFSTGMISVSDAYNVIRRWNAKNCYIVHYSGQQDIEDAKNQWFRGPTRPLAQDELQRMIDDHLRVTGGGGRFSIKVAQQGMIWTPSEIAEAAEDIIVGQKNQDITVTVGDRIEIEGLEKYVLIIEKKDGGNKLNVTIEDSINRFSSEFSEPHSSRKNDEIRLEAKPLKSFMMKGPELRMSLISHGDDSLVSINIAKGKKPVFADDIRLTNSDAKKLAHYISENFAISS
jgi:L-ascorbate metabolism protein UlaG (beta-lactamase superfamily)